MAAARTVTTAQGAEHVLVTPVWVLVVRIFQILISIVILGLAAWVIHGAYIDSEGLSLAVAVLTWVIVLYALLTEKIASFRIAYHIIAVMCLDGFMIIMWLAAFAATAAERATFVIPVSVDGCVSDGSLVNSNFCWKKRSLETRSVILFESGMDSMAAVAGLGALMWLLFIAVFAWTVTMFVRGRKQGLFAIETASDDHQMENQAATGAEKNTAAQQAVPAQAVPAQAAYPQQQQPPYQPPVSPSPVQYQQSPYQPPAHELQNSQTDQYPQYPQQMGAPVANSQAPYYPAAPPPQNNQTQ